MTAFEILAQAASETASGHGWAIVTAAWNHLANPRRALKAGGFGSVARYWQVVGRPGGFDPEPMRAAPAVLGGMARVVEGALNISGATCVCGRLVQNCRWWANGDKVHGDRV